MDPVSKAQTESSRPSTKFAPGNPTRFRAGISGNPSGRPKTAPFTKLCKKLMRSKAGKELVKQVMNDVLGKRGMASVLLLREIAERTDGKVSQELEITQPISSLSDGDLAQRLVKLDEEIAKRLEKVTV